MSQLPRIDSPCPLSADEQRAIDGRCDRCDRTVHSLDALDDDARRALFAASAGPICVSYRVPAPRRVGRVGALIAATLITTGAAFAAEPAAGPAADPQAGAPAPATGSRIARDVVRDLAPEHIVGAVNDPQDADMPADTATPVLPQQEAPALEPVLLVGGVRDPQAAQWVDVEDDAPALPVRTASREDARKR